MLTSDMVQSADDLRCKVMLAADVNGMDELFADDMVWVHASGGIDTKASMLERFGQGVMKYHALERTDITIRVFGDAAVAIGTVTIDGEVGSVRKKINSRFTGVWVKEGDRVRLASWQSARMD
ncbi:MAG: nuclear transport factor 2 family protein [Terricaulis sp.]